MYRTTAVAVFLLILSAAPAWADHTAGGSALALSALVSENSPSLSPNDKDTIVQLFGGNTSASYPAGRKITVSADKIVCRAGNFDITERSCELTFGQNTITLAGRRAHELFATIAEVGVPSEGAAGTIFEGLSQLTCTIDPSEIKQRSGGGANCDFNPGG